MKLKKNPSGRAFTLIEIMVAIALFSIIVAAIYSTWTLVIRSSQIGLAVAARAQRERVTVRTIETSLTCIQSFQASPQYYSFDITNSDHYSLSFTARLPDSFPRSGKYINPATGRDFPVRRLTYSIESGPNSEKDLVLRQKPILMDMDPDEVGTPLVLARYVKYFAVECLDTNQGKWVTDWKDTNSIPQQVRYSLALGGNNDSYGAAPTLGVTNIVTIPIVTLPTFLQKPR
jgi:prepilin-type N-terminal cleavage/methylation domain-containing protein